MSVLMLQRASGEGANGGRIREVKGVRNEFGVATRRSTLLFLSQFIKGKASEFKL